MTTATETTMLAYHDDPQIKDRYLARVRKHRQADQLVQGFGYWSDGKGCAVGCTIHSDDHATYETELGIPESLARLEDALFEGMGVEAARLWPERFLTAIRPGADLSRVASRLIIWILDEQVEWQKDWPDVQAVLRQVADLRRREVAGDMPGADEWSAAASAAWSAAWSAWSAWSARSAESAAWSAAWSAWSAESAAWSARSAESAESAAWSESAAAAWSESAAAAWSESAAAAWSESAESHERMADQLIALLEQA